MQESLLGKNIVVYDLEIKKPIEECKHGWKSYKEMGVSVGAAFDFRDVRFRIFMDDNLHELVERLNEPDTLVVAFNHIGFDNQLLRATPNAKDVTLKPDTELNNYDMLLVSKEGATGSQYKFVKGFKLDDHLKALKMPVKTGEGRMAPIWWQKGLTGKVIDYCLNDVRVETKLFNYIWKHEELACLYKSDPYKVKVPNIL